MVPLQLWLYDHVCVREDSFGLLASRVPRGLAVETFPVRITRRRDEHARTVLTTVPSSTAPSHGSEQPRTHRKPLTGAYASPGHMEA